MASWDAALSDRMSLKTLSAMSTKSAGEVVSPDSLVVFREIRELRINFQECCLRFVEEDEDSDLRTRIDSGMIFSCSSDCCGKVLP
mmetsp:Transcript_20129/g.34086  ORF Transcript_20129/g.34086 Transcript_20129/m.34086 type:complete len:86 (+) Transcript_20129:896-1153(+)